MAEEVKEEVLVSIAKDFAKAAFNKQDDLVFEDRLVDAAAEEAFEFIPIVAEMLDLQKKLGAKADSDHRYAEVVIGLADKLADVYSRFCSKEEVKAFLPKSGEQAGVSEAFASRGASALAKICTRP